mmetsp:Transcript_31197/g.72569  ORF Transcript_31197/g.72569 Transcript_31197/m.72569 type:complete len:201 (-) Transcript_31197:249-851(-)
MQRIHGAKHCDEIGQRDCASVLPIEAAEAQLCPPCRSGTKEPAEATHQPAEAEAARCVRLQDWRGRGSRGPRCVSLVGAAGAGFRPVGDMLRSVRRWRLHWGRSGLDGGRPRRACGRDTAFAGFSRLGCRVERREKNVEEAGDEGRVLIPAGHQGDEDGLKAREINLDGEPARIEFSTGRATTQACEEGDVSRCEARAAC